MIGLWVIAGCWLFAELVAVHAGDEAGRWAFLATLSVAAAVMLGRLQR